MFSTAATTPIDPSRPTAPLPSARAAPICGSMTSPPPLQPEPMIAGLPEEGDEGARYPVEQWHPAHCGHSRMRIDAEGRWYHEGRPIPRPALVRLFARLLRREPDGRHVLVTPVEMLDIDVEDAPLIAVDMASEGSGPDRTLRLRIGATGDWIAADAAHPIRVEQGPAGPRPYLGLDAGLRARLARPVYYALAEAAIAEGQDPPGLWSGGAFHALEPVP